MVEIINKAIEYFATSYFGAIVSIIFGIYVIKDTIKNPIKDWFTPLQGNMRGWAGGIGFIFLGIFVIIAKLIGKL